ncbi:hypothetical protein Enr10x_53630 [Gimesia panareensis]|uniref:Uncharacterized protein n=1 Tax=Gimesia panareensis TaxID=2527978 RepID=A0A517QEH5_9PLAN|nr:hypothetical protein Enr10x_53630 [Gimesia panareensis]QDU53086.1 hypothetical protein Pan110_54700 [Gimesia panareensis]
MVPLNTENRDLEHPTHQFCPDQKKTHSDQPMDTKLDERFAASLENQYQHEIRISSTPKENAEQQYFSSETACMERARLDQKSVMAEKERGFGPGRCAIMPAPFRSRAQQ